MNSSYHQIIKGHFVSTFFLKSLILWIHKMWHSCSSRAVEPAWSNMQCLNGLHELTAIVSTHLSSLWRQEKMAHIWAFNGMKSGTAVSFFLSTNRNWQKMLMSKLRCNCNIPACRYSAVLWNIQMFKLQYTILETEMYYTSHYYYQANKKSLQPAGLIYHFSLATGIFLCWKTYHLITETWVTMLCLQSLNKSRLPLCAGNLEQRLQQRLLAAAN